MTSNDASASPAIDQNFPAGTSQAASHGVVQHPDGNRRCWWCGNDPDYGKYHDSEWGVPEHDDIQLFEKLCLEGFQAGLSWLTILRKRPAFRRAFAGFDPDVVARYSDSDLSRLISDPSIVRHQGKIEATIANARACLDLREAEGSLDTYIWGFAPDPSPIPDDGNDILTVTAESIALAKDLKRRGWRFLGPTTVYAFMQSMGLVNDHLRTCSFRARQ